jgi:hypothetical protein
MTFARTSISGMTPVPGVIGFPGDGTLDVRIDSSANTIEIQ